MNIMDVASSLSLPSKEDIIEAIGLAATRAPSDQLLTRTLSVFAAGILVGAGLALLLAPKAGADLRQDIEDGFAELQKRFAHPASDEGRGAT
jgi:hypothetical protein